MTQLSDLLDLCLQQFLSGQDMIASALAGYSDYADKLCDELEAALWLRTQRVLVEARPGYLVASRRSLVAQINAGLPAKPRFHI